MRAGTVVPPLTGEVPQGDSEWRRALEGLRGAYADKTITECAKHFRAFSRWCFAEGVDALPASAETVADHVDSIFPRYGRRSIESRLASVRRVHQLLDLPDATRALVVQLAFRRGVRTYGGYSRQARGLTVAYRDRLLAACPSTLLACATAP